MKKISKNGAGIVLLVLSLIGLDVDIAFAESVAAAIGLLVSVGLMIVNQVSRSDVAAFFFKR